MPDPTHATAATAATDDTADMLTKLRSSLKTVQIEGEQYFVAEGDMLLDKDQLEIYANQRQILAREQAVKAQKAAFGAGDIIDDEPQRLVGILVNNKLVRWKPGTILSYSIRKNTFSDAHFQMVRENMARATAAWEEVCGIKFQYRPEFDENPTPPPGQVLFTVREIDAQGQFIAAAFFPNDPRDRRRVLIDPSYYEEDLGFDPVGVLRHELGHTLGFRHEHIRSGAPPQCPDESTVNTFDFTPYDPRSVMHYFCGGVGSRELAITDLDRTGAQKLYGPSLNTFTFAEP